MQITREHELAMFVLPDDGRWKSEAQLIGLTELGDRTCGIYVVLHREGFCERKLVPILTGLVDSGEFLRAYRTLQCLRDKFRRAVALQRSCARQ